MNTFIKIRVINRINFIVVLLSVYFFNALFSSVYAQNTDDNKKYELAESVLNLMQFETNTVSLVDKNFPLIMASIGKSVQDSQLSAERKQQYLEKFSEYWPRFMKSPEVVARFKGNMVAAYVNYFTLEELEELLVFYKTPLGQKLNESLLKISQIVESDNIQLSKEIINDIVKLIIEELGSNDDSNNINNINTNNTDNNADVSK